MAGRRRDLQKRRGLAHRQKPITVRDAHDDAPACVLGRRFGGSGRSHILEHTGQPTELITAGRPLLPLPCRDELPADADAFTELRLRQLAHPPQLTQPAPVNGLA